MSYSPPSAVVIDANIAIKAVLPTEGTPGILRRLAGFHQAQAKLFAPDILLPEAVSVIRRAIFDGWILEAEGQTAVEDIFRLGVLIVPSDPGLCQAALAWAARLEQAKAYDGFYLAVAERCQASLWTADERLRNRLKQHAGLPWMRWIDVE